MLSAVVQLLILLKVWSTRKMFKFNELKWIFAYLTETDGCQICEVKLRWAKWQSKTTPTTICTTKPIVKNPLKNNAKTQKPELFALCIRTTWWRKIKRRSNRRRKKPAHTHTHIFHDNSIWTKRKCTQKEQIEKSTEWPVFKVRYNIDATNKQQYGVTGHKFTIQ